MRYFNAWMGFAVVLVVTVLVLFAPGMAPALNSVFLPAKQKEEEAA